MKRLLPILLTLLLLTACAKDPADTRQTSAAPNTQQTATEATAAPETSLLDNDACAVAVTNVTMDDVWGLQVELRCENKTDVTQFYTLSSCACQGWLLNADFLLQLNAHETMQSKFNVFPTDLARCGITEVSACELHLLVKNFDDLGKDPFADETVVLQTPALSVPPVSPAPVTVQQDALPLAAEADQCAMSICGCETDTLFPYNLVVYLENSSSRDLTFSWSEVCVNGSPVDLWFVRTVPAGLRSVIPVYFDEDAMKELNIKTFETVDLVQTVIAADTFETVSTETVHYVNGQ